ncbi:hypothetical protein DFH11DRAFT_1726199 [Phellopilus nigrolimitatus]|nr:hypothetical protein DFH11DRAFT_1726199 [Phellopilus nigrolimitatus]
MLAPVPGVMFSVSANALPPTQQLVGMPLMALYFSEARYKDSCRRQALTSRHCHARFTRTQANFLYIALELCPASRSDIVERPDLHREISNMFDPKCALLQITASLCHLHAHADSKEGMDADVLSGLKGLATWISQKAGYDPRNNNNNSNGDSGLSAVGSQMSKPVSTMVTEESRFTGKRYADRPEGVDQFGGEESERQKEEPRSSGTGVSEVELKRYKDRPEGLDQFGGEEAERKL